MIGLRVDGVARVAGRFARLPQEMVEAEKRGIHAAGLYVEGRVKKKFVGYSGRRGDENLQVRSGALRRSLNTSRPERDSQGYKVAVGYRRGTVDRYARIQEEGKTIQGPMSVPLPAALTAAGVLRFTSHGGVWTRGIPGGFWFTSRAGRGIFAIRQGSELVPLAVRKDSVTIPPHKTLARSLAESKAKVVKLVAFQVTRALQKVGRG